MDAYTIISTEATEENTNQEIAENNQTEASQSEANIESGISYEELLELYKESLESQQQMAADLKQMQKILNDNFKTTTQAPATEEEEIESYLSSTNSLTGRLLEKYEKEKS